MRRPPLRMLALPLALGLIAGADEPGQARPKDPQSAFEPRSDVGEGQKFLARFVGDWDVVKTFHPREGEPARTRGECRQSMVHEGRFLKSEFVFSAGPTRTTGTGLIGFEAESGTFTSVWTDSRSTRMSFRQGRDKFDGREIVLHGRSLDAEPKEMRRSRTVTRLEEDGRRIVHRQYNAGPDGTERLLMELVLTRKAEAPAAGQH